MTVINILAGRTPNPKVETFNRLRRALAGPDVAPKPGGRPKGKRAAGRVPLFSSEASIDLLVRVCVPASVTTLVERMPQSFIAVPPVPFQQAKSLFVLLPGPVTPPTTVEEIVMRPPEAPMVMPVPAARVVSLAAAAPPDALPRTCALAIEGRRAAAKVPDVMLLAFVVSVVAEATKLEPLVFVQVMTPVEVLSVQSPPSVNPPNDPALFHWT